MRNEIVPSDPLLNNLSVNNRSVSDAPPSAACCPKGISGKKITLECLGLSQAITLGGLALAPELFEDAAFLIPLGGIVSLYLLLSSILGLYERRLTKKQNALQSMRDFCVVAATLVFMLAQAPVALLAVTGSKAFFDLINFVRHAKAIALQGGEMHAQRQEMIKSGLSAVENILIFLALLTLLGHVGLPLVAVLILAAAVSALVTLYKIKQRMSLQGPNRQLDHTPQARESSFSDRNHQFYKPSNEPQDSSAVDRQKNNNKRKNANVKSNSSNDAELDCMCCCLFCDCTNDPAPASHPNESGCCESEGCCGGCNCCGDPNLQGGSNDCCGDGPGCEGPGFDGPGCD